MDGEDFSWLWDVDLEEVSADILDAVCCGNRSDELAMRLKYAEIPTSSIAVIPDLKTALDAALQNVEAGGTLYILSSYTPTRELHAIMQRRGWVKHIWEE